MSDDLSLNVSVRRVTVDDWSELRRLRLEALDDTPDAYGFDLRDARKLRPGRWRDFAKRQLWFFAERAGDVVGVSSGGLNDRHPGTRWLYGMYVTPRARGTGVAEALVAAVGEWAKGEGASELYLHVTQSVARANAFYKKIGFAPTGESFVMPRDKRLTLLTMKRDLD